MPCGEGGKRERGNWGEKVNLAEVSLGVGVNDQIYPHLGAHVDRVPESPRPPPAL